jgi:hypothetical protein
MHLMLTEMRGSDIALGWVDAASCTGGCLYDYNTVQYQLPVKDTQQNNQVNEHHVKACDSDFQLVAGSLVGGILTMEYTRLLNSPDTTQDRNIDPNSIMHLLWSGTSFMAIPVLSQIAVQPKSTPTMNGTQFFKHDYQGTIDITFSHASVCPSRQDDIQISISLNTTMNQFNTNQFMTSLETGMELALTSLTCLELGVDGTRVALLSVEEIEDPFCPECNVVDFTMSNYLGEI